MVIISCFREGTRRRLTVHVVKQRCFTFYLTCRGIELVYDSLVSMGSFVAWRRLRSVCGSLATVRVAQSQIKTRQLCKYTIALVRCHR